MPFPNFFYKLFLVLVFSSSVYFSNAQESMVIYSSDAERKQFESIDSARDIIRLALLAKSSEENAAHYLNKIDDFVNQLNVSPIKDGRSSVKKIKQLFQQIHSSFLKKYDEKASMADMFENGHYQCVTASLLYGYIFESLSIPYQIKELPQHVLVIAYPDSHNIMLETTNPTEGLFVPDMKSQQKFVNNLVRNKYLEQKHVDSLGTEKAFNDFFYGETNISLKQLVGLLYYNMFIDYATQEDVHRAYSASIKTNKLYPARKHDFLQNMALRDVLEKCSFDKIEDWELLTYFVNNFDNEYSRLFLNSKFLIEIQQSLFKSNNRERLESVHNYLDSNLNDSTLSQELASRYYEESARAYMIAWNFKEALPHVEKVLSYSPESPVIQSMLLECLLKTTTNNAPTKRKIEELEIWSSKYPFISENQRVKAFYLYYYATQTTDAYDAGKEKEANENFKKMHDMLKSNEDVREAILDKVIYVFQHVSFQQLMKGRKDLATKTALEGLELYPGNQKLKNALEEARKHKF